MRARIAKWLASAVFPRLYSAARATEADALAFEQATHARNVEMAREHVALADREAARLIDEATATAAALIDSARAERDALIAEATTLEARCDAARALYAQLKKEMT
jgi:hypothetical protein